MPPLNQNCAEIYVSNKDPTTYPRQIGLQPEPNRLLAAITQMGTSYPDLTVAGERCSENCAISVDIKRLQALSPFTGVAGATAFL